MGPRPRRGAVFVDTNVLVYARDSSERSKPPVAEAWLRELWMAAAQLQNCAVLLAEDLQHGRVCGTVTVRNPFAQRIEDDRASYAAQAAPVSRHRGRGRPRLQAIIPQSGR